MESYREKYEAVIGLEVHAQMLTHSKAYSNDANAYGDSPNTNVSVITLGHPGTLPVMNKKTIENAIKLGLALHCEIAENQHFARKNYFYPDLPKGYQITQDTTPICTKGWIEVKDENLEIKKIGITRIHMEEDAGKSIHDLDVRDTLVDLNRAGVPLLEIVTEPDLRSSTEAYNYLTEIRKLVRYLDICDGNMEEGSLRCDANISVRLKGANEFGTKVEVKNMNSIRNVQRAIEFEIHRQIEALEKGELIYQETRNYDALKNTTTTMRSKEMANDYRYFPEPDLQPIHVTMGQIEQIRSEMPALASELFNKYTQSFKLSEYDAQVLTDHKPIAMYYEDMVQHTQNYKSAANWLMTDIKAYLNSNGVGIEEFPLLPSQMAELIAMIDEKVISHSAASSKLFPVWCSRPDADAKKLAEELNIIQDNNEDAILTFIHEVIKQHEPETLRYKNGEKQLIGFFMGQLMKVSKGKADPKSANQLLRNELDKV